MIFVAVVSVATGLIHSILFPFVAIKESELPPTILQKLAEYFPNLLTTIVQQQKARQRFLINGRLGDRVVQITFVVTPESEISSVEMKVMSKESFIVRSAIEHFQVPADVAARLHPFLAADTTPMQSTHAVAGMIGDQNAYRIEFDSAIYQYRFEANDDGELTGFRKRLSA